MAKKALITGITGQDGSFLAEFLLNKGYEVHGLVRHIDFEDQKNRMWRINHLVDNLHLYDTSLENYTKINDIIERIVPDECYHLAAQSYVNYTFQDDIDSINFNTGSTHLILSAIKERAPECRFYFAATSEMFGRAKITPQNEETPFYPRSPYGISKLSGFHLTLNYREYYKLFACNGILFNHESERRGMEFVTRKISHTVASIKAGKEKILKLGNLKPKRDWGYAPDYVEGMWLMLQQPKPDDYVLATGLTHSVEDFTREAFAYVGLNWRDHVIYDELLYRPEEKFPLCGDPSKAKRVFGWKSTTSFESLVKKMVEADLSRVKSNFPPNSLY